MKWSDIICRVDLEIDWLQFCQTLIDKEIERDKSAAELLELKKQVRRQLAAAIQSSDRLALQGSWGRLPNGEIAKGKAEILGYKPSQKVLNGVQKKYDARIKVTVAEQFGVSHKGHINATNAMIH